MPQGTDPESGSWDPWDAGDGDSWSSPDGRMPDRATWQPDPNGRGVRGDRESVLLYEARRKSEGIAVLAEFLLPGLGSVYGDHIAGAGLTWGLMIVGFYAMLEGWRSNEESMATLGVIGVVGGRIYGLFDAYQSTSAFNTQLRRELLLGERVGLYVFPVRGPGGSMAVGPGLVLRF